MLLPTAIKTTSALGEGLGSTISLHPACGLYNSRPCLPRDTASVGKLHKTFTLSSPSQCRPSASSPGEKARKGRGEADPRCGRDAAGTQQRAALGRILPPLPGGEGLQLTGSTVFPRRNRGSWLVPSER